ncbi:MAG: M50 family metallopeptidase [Patescibacteria group bacterium]
MSVLNVISILIIMSLLVLIHEFGHFIASKKSGVKVEEFGLGYPPRLWGKQIGETLYSINLLPFGGFVKIVGEGAESEEEEKEYLKDSRSFASKSPKQKILILSAGILMNLLLAIVLFYVFFILNNFKTFYIPMIFDHKFRFGREEIYKTVVFDMEEDSAAKQYGINVGDVILKIDGISINSVEDMRKVLSGKAGETVKAEVLSLGDDLSQSNIRTLDIIPKTNVSPQGLDEGDSIIGVYLGDAVSIVYDKPLEKLLSGPLHSYNILSYSVIAFGKIIGLSITTKDISPVSNSMAGPVGVFNVIGSVFKEGGSNVSLALMNTVGIISLGFAFSNILPIPALDGGRIAFKVYEAATKKKVSINFESKVHKFGMITLLIFAALITFKDLHI